MKKKRKIVVILFFFISILSYCHYKKIKNVDLPLLENIEAIASGEQGNQERCMGIGDIECRGDKVLLKYDSR